MCLIFKVNFISSNYFWTFFQLRIILSLESHFCNRYFLITSIFQSFFFSKHAQFLNSQSITNVLSSSLIWTSRILNIRFDFFHCVYSKVPIIRTIRRANLAVHAMYCQTGIRTVRIIGTLEYLKTTTTNIRYSKFDTSKLMSCRG